MYFRDQGRIQDLVEGPGDEDSKVQVVMQHFCHIRRDKCRVLFSFPFQPVNENVLCVCVCVGPHWGVWRDGSIFLEVGLGRL